MAGQAPYEAFDNFKGPLQRALSCVTDAVFVALASDGCSPGMNHVLTFNDGDAVRISDDESLALSVTFYYQIVEDDHPERGPWKVSTRAYMHTLENLGGQEIVAYHWHPEQGSKVTFPHMHFGVGLGRLPKAAHKAHVPTGRVPLEEVVRFAITDFRATPKREDWSEVLADTQRAHERWRTWGPDQGHPKRAARAYSFCLVCIFGSTLMRPPSPFLSREYSRAGPPPAQHRLAAGFRESALERLSEKGVLGSDSLL